MIKVALLEGKSGAIAAKSKRIRDASIYMSKKYRSSFYS